MKRKARNSISNRILQKWSEALKSKRLLMEIGRDPATAKLIFGHGAVARGTLTELTLILEARLITNLSDRQVAERINGIDFVLDWLIQSGEYAKECRRKGDGMFVSITPASRLSIPAASETFAHFKGPSVCEDEIGAFLCRDKQTVRLIRRCARAVITRAMSDGGAITKGA